MCKCVDPTVDVKNVTDNQKETSTKRNASREWPGSKSRASRLQRIFYKCTMKPLELSVSLPCSCYLDTILGREKVGYDVMIPVFSLCIVQ